MKTPCLLQTIPAAAMAALFISSPTAGAEVALERGEGKIEVTVGGEPFTTYVFEGGDRPVLYPLIGPGGVRMNREYPFKNGVEGEASDHPHHTSLWYTHGDVNGVDFWAVGDGRGKVVNKGVEVVEGSVISQNSWQDADGKELLTDTTTLGFGELEGARFIDYSVTLKASAGDVVFADTKEGTMGIRTHPNLRLSNDEKRGVTTANGKAVNSAGDEGKNLWGKHAAWVDYWGEIDGKTVGVAIFDHPTNPRHPTTWHAREYGLVAANPFGLSYFEKSPKGSGDFKIPAGESITFRYRFLFHEGGPEDAKVAERFKEFSEQE